MCQKWSDDNSGFSILTTITVKFCYFRRSGDNDNSNLNRQWPAQHNNEHIASNHVTKWHQLWGHECVSNVTECQCNHLWDGTRLLILINDSCETVFRGKSSQRRPLAFVDWLEFFKSLGNMCLLWADTKEHVCQHITKPKNCFNMVYGQLHDLHQCADSHWQEVTRMHSIVAWFMDWYMH